MTDPATAAASSFFGVKLASLVAGFAGGRRFALLFARVVKMANAARRRYRVAHGRITQ